MSRPAEPCTECECVSCSACGGTGTVWFSLSGRYLGNKRCDDLDTLEHCEECGGSGIIETCTRCQLLEEDEAIDFKPDKSV